MIDDEDSETQSNENDEIVDVHGVSIDDF